MNAQERFFLLGVLIVGVAVVLVALHAVGVVLPFLPEREAAVAPLLDDEDAWAPLPAPRADDVDEAGLLAELRRENAGRTPAPVPAAPPAPPEDAADLPGTRAAEGAGPGRPARDPLVDALKAAVDVTDAGQLMAFLIGTFTPKGTKLGEEDVAFLLDALGAQEDWGVRNLLFAHLERLGGDAVTDGVLAFLHASTDRASSIRAVQALGALGDDRAAAGLVAVLAGSKDPRIQQEAFQSLLRTKNGTVSDDLIRALGATSNPATKRYALAALSQLDAGIGAEVVMRYATSGDDYERSLGRKSLRDIRSPAAVPALGASLLSSSDPALRTDLLRTLGRIRDPGAVDSVGRVLLFDGNLRLRMEAVRTLAQIGTRESLPALATAASQDDNAGVRKAAERAIQYVGQQEAARLARR